MRKREIKKRTGTLGLSFSVNKDIPHNEFNLNEAIDDTASDVILILIASGTSDISDVGPMAVESLGGKTLRFVIPVNPGNLLFLGWLSDKPIISLPGYAKFPAINGTDWVISRVVCRHMPSEHEFDCMRLGGFLKENSSRPTSRLKSGI